ncbi:C39 family peptidase [bacterium]|nr:C39 family peptidase [bacterium]
MDKAKERIISNGVKKYLIIIAIFLLLGVAYIYRSRSYQVIEIDLPETQQYQDFIKEPQAVSEEDNSEEPTDVLAFEEDPEDILGEKIEEENEPVKTSINLDIPFTSQAPTANWDQPFQDACEEASILMVDYYYQNKKFPSKEEVEGILLEMVAWQEENWQGHYNLPIAKVAEYTVATLDYQIEVIENLTAEKIKNFLNQGIPVVVPADGHKLNNPNFSGDGPDYHMLLIKGYVDNKFITNDPGTRNGADFVYTSQNLMESIFDWDIKKSSTTGSKRGLVLFKN